MNRVGLVLPLTLSFLVTTVCLPLTIKASSQKAPRQTSKLKRQVDLLLATSRIRAVSRDTLLLGSLA